MSARRPMEPGTRLFCYGLMALGIVSLMGFLRLSGLWAEYEPLRLGVMVMLFLGGLTVLCLDTIGLMCLLLAFLPFSTGVLKFELGIVTFSPYSVGLMLLAAKGLYLLAVGRARMRLGLPDWVMAGLCLLYLGTTLTSETIVAAGFMAFHGLFIPVLSYFCVRIHVTGRDELRLCLFSFILGATALCAVSVAQMLLVQERSGTLGVSPVALATLTLAPLLTGFYTPYLRTRLRLLVVPLCLGGLAVSLSRVYLLLMLASPLLIRVVRRGWTFVFCLAFIALSFALTLTATLSVPREYAQQVIAHGEVAALDYMLFQTQDKGLSRLTSPRLFMATIQNRLVTYRVGLEHFMNNPVAGKGLYRGAQMVTQHNIHIQLLDTGGVLGFALTMLLLLLFFHGVSGPARGDPFLAMCALTQLMILVNSVTNGFLYNYFVMVFFLVMGFVRVRLEQTGAAPAPARRALAKEAACASS